MTSSKCTARLFAPLRAVLPPSQRLQKACCVHCFGAALLYDQEIDAGLIPR